MEQQSKWRRGLRRPDRALIYLWSVARGRYYLLKFRLLGRRVVAGRNFRVVGRLDIRGPGTVIFGDDCGVASSPLQVTTPWTHTPEAVIRFGNRVFLTGTRIGCTSLVEVEDDVGLSDARIMDNDFHRIDARSAKERIASSGRSKPVRIKRNAWLGTDAMILKGVTVGENAVVGARAVVTANVPANAVVFGNPARVVWRVAAPKPSASEADVRAGAVDAAPPAPSSASQGSAAERAPVATSVAG